MALRGGTESIEARPRTGWLLALTWWALLRLPFWRPLPDFLDSTEYFWRVEGGFWSGFHNGGSHLPYQREVYAPAGGLFSLTHWSPQTCISLVVLVYGLAAYGALLVLWRRFFPPRVAAWSSTLYPLLAGIGLADLSTYSMSAIHAFLFGGTAALAESLAVSCHAPHRARGLAVLAAVLFDLAADTHLIALLWAGVPFVVLAAYVGQAPAMRCPHCGEVPRPLRLKRALTSGVLLPGLGVALALLFAGWDLAHIHVADTTWHGVLKLLRRDAYIRTEWRFTQGDIVLVTGGLGIYFVLIGGLRWAWREGAWAWLALAGLMASFLGCALQWYLGFPGRLYLPALAWFVPFMVLGTWADTAQSARPLRWALPALLFLQTGATFAHVIGTRRFGPHPGEEEWAFTKELEKRGDAFVSHIFTRTYNAVRAEHRVYWGDADALEKVLKLRDAGTARLFLSSQTLHFPLYMRDGHLISPIEPHQARAPSPVEQHLFPWAAMLLDAPLGRTEFAAELVRKEQAPPLKQRLERASSYLHDGGLFLVVTPPEHAWFARAYGPTFLDCVSAEVYDAYELSAYASVPSLHCAPLQLGLTDGSGVLLRPLPRRSAFDIKLQPWKWAQPNVEFRLGAQEFSELSLAEAEERLSHTAVPYAAVLQTGSGERVRLAVHPLAP